MKIIYLYFALFIFSHSLTYGEEQAIIPIDLTKESQLISSSEVINFMKAHEGINKTIFNFANELSPFSPHIDILRGMKNYSNQLKHAHIEGIPPLKNVIHQQFSSKKYSISQTLIAPSLSSLLYNFFSVFDGDIILLAPFNPLYKKQLDSLKKNVYLFHTSKEECFKVQPQKLDDFLQKLSPHSQKMIVFNNPVNPTGEIYNKDEIKKLAEVLKKYNIIILSDEEYSGLEYPIPFQYYSLANEIPERTIRLFDISKRFSPEDFHMGFATFPDSLTLLFQTVKNLSDLNMGPLSSPEQFAAAVALDAKNNAINNYILKERIILRDLSKKLKNKLNNLHIKCIGGQSAWFMLLDFSPYREKLLKKGITNSQELTRALREQAGVFMTSGEELGLSADLLITRFSFNYFVGDEALKILGEQQKLPSYQFASHLFIGLDVLKKWLDN